MVPSPPGLLDRLFLGLIVMNGFGIHARMTVEGLGLSSRAAQQMK